LITNPIYSKFHKEAESFLTQFPGGDSIIKFISKAKRDTKELLAPSSIFEKLGMRYLGPIDGHDIHSLVHFFEFAKLSDEPIVLHLLTQKGKGFPAAINEPEKWHGAAPFNPSNNGAPEKPKNTPAKFQDVFGDSLVKIASEDTRVVGITAAMPSGTGLNPMIKAFPDRFFDVGIAEEHAVLMAAGMASKGMRPVCAIYSTFLQRAYDQIIHDVCLQNLPVTFCLDRAGLSPNDGPTHHGLFDLSYLRCVPNSVIMQPACTEELFPMLKSAVNCSKPTFIRYPRGSGSQIKGNQSVPTISLGKADCLREGEKIAIWAIGDFVALGEQVYQHLLEEYQIKISLVNARFIKPLDTELLKAHALNHEKIITIEDNVIAGGFGSAVLEFLQESDIYTPVIRMGWPDKFIPHGNDIESLRKSNGLDLQGILRKLKPILNLTRPLCIE